MANGDRSRLSLLGQGLARGNPLLDIGLGLLQAAGPSRTPVSLGQALASGLSFAQQRDLERTRNEAIRDKLAQAKAARTATEEFFGSLEAPAPGTGTGFGVLRPEVLAERTRQAQQFGLDPAQARFLQLQSRIDPQAALKTTGGLLFEPETQPSAEGQKIEDLRAELGREPTEQEKLAVFGASPRKSSFIETADQLQIPREQQQALFIEKSRGGNISRALNPLKELSAQLEVQLRQEQLAKAQTERAKTTEARTAKKRDLTQDIQTGIGKTLEALRINDALEGTSLESGFGAEARELGVGAVALGASVLGIDQSKRKKLASQAQRLGQIGTDLQIQQAFELFAGRGAVSDQKLQEVLELGISNTNSPATNRQAASDRLEGFLQAADNLGVAVPNRKQVEQEIQRAREVSQSAPAGSIEQGQARARQERQKTRKLRFDPGSGQLIPQ